MRPLLLTLAMLLLVGKLRASAEDGDDDDDDDDEGRHRFSPIIHHFSPAVHHFGSPVLPLGLRTTTTRPSTTARATSITPTRIILSSTIRTVTRTPQTTTTPEATTTTTSARPTTTSRPKRQPSTTTTTASTPITECGKQFNGPSRLIVGGRNADPFEWPWMVALLERPDFEQFCGGVLLTERHVLTAAHCFNSRRSRDVVVLLGEYNLFRNQGFEEYFLISDLQRHPEYTDLDSHYRNDLAILELDRSTKFNAAIRPVCLPSPDAHNFNGLNATALGWGDTDGDEKIERWAHILQEVELPIVRQEECAARHFDISIIPEREICAAPNEGGRDTCTGDSGGPLLVQVNERWTIIGLVSWGPTRCGSGLPGVYTRVDGFLDWIWDRIR